MSSLAGNLRRGLRDTAVALRVAPVEVALGIATAVAWSAAMTAKPNAMQAWAEVAILCALTGGIAWIATLLHGLGALSARRRWLLTLAGFAGVVLYDRTLLDLDRTAEGWRAMLLLAAVALAITLTPLLSAHGHARDRRFREVNLRLITRGVGVALYAGALYLGLALAIAAVDSLFELHLNDEIYAHVFGALAFGLVPWLIVGGTPAITAPPGPPAEGMRIVRRFGIYLFLPLLAIYYLILYAYLVRIAVTAELPRNLVSPLALLAGIIGALGVMMFAGADEAGTPESDVDRPELDAARPAQGLRPLPAGIPWPIRLAVPLFLPLGALGLWAIGVRVSQYGWTEFRYVRDAALVALLALAALGSWSLLRRRRLRAYPVPLVLSLVSLLCALGPWSPSAVARRSQQTRLMLALRAADVDASASDLAAAPSRSVPDSLYREIRSAGRYLTEHFGNEAVVAVAGQAAAAERGSYDLAATLGLKARPNPAAPRVATARLDEPLPTDELGEGSLYVIEVPARHEVAPTGVVRGDSTLLHLRVGGRALTVDLAEMAAWALAADTTGGPGAGPARRAQAIPARSGGARLRLPDATLPLLGANGRSAGRFVVRWLRVDRDSTGVHVRAVEGLAVVSQPGS